MPFFDVDPESFQMPEIWAQIYFPNDKQAAAQYTASAGIYLLQQVAEMRKREADWIGNIGPLAGKGAESLEARKKNSENLQQAVILENMTRLAELGSAADLFDKSVTRQQNQAQDKGFLSGRVLFRVLQMDQAQRPPVVKKALDLVVEEIHHPESILDADFDPKSRGESTLKTCWREYRNVAHWWAASWVMYKNIKDYQSALFEGVKPEWATGGIFRDMAHPHSPTSLPLLNATAESFLEMAASITIGEQAKMPRPLLDPETAIRLPPAFPKDPDPLGVPELEEWAKNYLDSH